MQLVVALTGIKWGKTEAETGITFTTQPFARITTKIENDTAGEAMKKQLAFGRLKSISTTYFQESAMVTMGEWRDGLYMLLETHVHISRLCRLSPALVRIPTYTKPSQTVLTWEL